MSKLYLSSNYQCGKFELLACSHSSPYSSTLLSCSVHLISLSFVTAAVVKSLLVSVIFMVFPSASHFGLICDLHFINPYSSPIHQLLSRSPFRSLGKSSLLSAVISANLNLFLSDQRIVTGNLSRGPFRSPGKFSLLLPAEIFANLAPFITACDRLTSSLRFSCGQCLCYILCLCALGEVKTRTD